MSSLEGLVSIGGRVAFFLPKFEYEQMQNGFEKGVEWGVTSEALFEGVIGVLACGNLPGYDCEVLQWGSHIEPNSLEVCLLSSLF